MTQFKRLLVALDLTDMDKVLIKYVAGLTEKFDIDRIYFLHVVKNLELSEDLTKKYPELLAPVDETCEKQIRFELDKYFPKDTKATIDLDIEEGNITELILKWIKVKSVDLVVLGSKPSDEASGVKAHKIAKLANSSVAFIPEKPAEKLEKIIVPIDFSETSQLAIKTAIQLTEKNDQSEIIGLNVFDVPTGYHTSGKSYEEFAEIMKENAEKEFEKFVKQYKIDPNRIKGSFMLNKDKKDIVEEIHQFAEQENADAIVMGSQGKSIAAILLLGSTAEKLMKYDFSMPLFIIKDKTKSVGFLDALLRI